MISSSTGNIGRRFGISSGASPLTDEDVPLFSETKSKFPIPVVPDGENSQSCDR